MADIKLQMKLDMLGPHLEEIVAPNDSEPPWGRRWVTHPGLTPREGTPETSPSAAWMNQRFDQVDNDQPEKRYGLIG